MHVSTEPFSFDERWILSFIERIAPTLMSNPISEWAKSVKKRAGFR
jgi:hypothetical protein